MSPAYSPRTNLMYVTVREECATFFSEKQPYVEGRNYWGGHVRPEDGAWGALRAFDLPSGGLRWEYRHTTPTFAGALATAGDIVFTGDMEGNFIALHAETGLHLWHFQTGGPILASPISYAVRGQQYVAIAAHGALLAFGLPERES
jgi:alcohol dehydrogenase (cytochrome c)